MNWEDTIVAIRKDPSLKDLVRDAYFDEDLVVNVERFRGSPEFIEELRLIRSYKPGTVRLMDIGSGNGIAAVAFALEGYEVVAIEPDSSDTIGAGAIRKLKSHYRLEKLQVKEIFGEQLCNEDNSFDVMYVRQALHHAHDLNMFVKAAANLLKPDGIFMAVREHVIYDEKDKEKFLASHPLHRFYGGENAFTLNEYRHAFEQAGLKPVAELGHYENVVNYFALTECDIELKRKKELQEYKTYLAKRLPVFGSTRLAWMLYKNLKKINTHKLPDERKIDGRLYSFIYKR